MNTKKKGWLILASCLVILGMCTFVFSMFMIDWDFKKLNTVEYQTSTYNISQDFTKIEIHDNTTDIKIVPTEEQMCKVVCYEQENLKHSVSVEQGILIIKQTNEREWYEYLGINFEEPLLTVYLPMSEYQGLMIDSDTSDVEIAKDFIFNSVDIKLSTGDVKMLSSVRENLKIVASTGDITMENLSANFIDLKVSTGDIELNNLNCYGDIKLEVSTGNASLNNVTCVNLVSTGTTGDLVMQNVLVSQSLNVTRNTGDVSFYNSDANTITIETSTGDVSGSLLTSKIFSVTTDTGEIRVPNSTTGGLCKITTDTGDVTVSIN